MTTSHSNNWIWIGIACLGFICFIRSCPRERTFDPHKLPGTWRSSDEGVETTWIFSADGSFQYQAKFQNGWIGLITGSFDIPGHWKLEGKQLTIELTGTPPLAILAGQNWNGVVTTIHIQRLTKEDLTFSDSELKFRRSLVPVGK